MTCEKDATGQKIKLSSDTVQQCYSLTVKGLLGVLCSGNGGFIARTCVNVIFALAEVCCYQYPTLTVKTGHFDLPQLMSSLLFCALDCLSLLGDPWAGQWSLLS